VLDLVCARQRPVEPLDQRRDRVRRVQRLVGVHLPRGVGVGGDLPARAVDRLEPRLDALHGLAARERAEGRHERLVAHELPELLGAAAGEGVLDLDRAAELLDVGLTWVERDGEEKRKEREGGKRREEKRERGLRRTKKEGFLRERDGATISASLVDLLLTGTLSPVDLQFSKLSTLQSLSHVFSLTCE
jgi:hypothetical protein